MAESRSLLREFYVKQAGGGLDESLSNRMTQEPALCFSLLLFNQRIRQ